MCAYTLKYSQGGGTGTDRTRRHSRPHNRCKILFICSASVVFRLLYVFVNLSRGAQSAFQKGEAASHERASQNFENTFKTLFSAPKKHLLWSGSFPAVPLSAVYHLLSAPTNPFGVTCVLSLPHRHLSLDTNTVWHNVELRVRNGSSEVLHCTHSLARDNWSVSRLTK